MLESSKKTISGFHYKYIKVKYDDKAKMLLTDTNSFYYIIETEIVYKEFTKTNNDLTLAIIQKIQTIVVIQKA